MKYRLRRIPSSRNPSFRYSAIAGALCGKTVSSSLTTPSAPRPLHRLLDQRRADPLSPRAGRDHQPELGHVAAERAAVARDRQATNDAVGGLRDQDCHVCVALDAADVPPLVAACPVVGQPELWFPRDLSAELDQRVSVAGNRGTDDQPVAHAGTTMPCPPRLGSPAAASEPSARRSTAAAPPK